MEAIIQVLSTYIQPRNLILQSHNLSPFNCIYPGQQTEPLFSQKCQRGQGKQRWAQQDRFVFKGDPPSKFSIFLR